MMAGMNSPENKAQYVPGDLFGDFAAAEHKTVVRESCV